MELYAIHRRRLCTPDELPAVDGRSQAELDRRTDQVRKIRSYVFDEEDGTVGTICVYQATGHEAIREHAAAASLPVDEIQRIDLIDVQRPDPDAVLA
jgi:hypothetical protein